MLPTMVVEGFHHQLSLPVYREDGDIPISPRFFLSPHTTPDYPSPWRYSSDYFHLNILWLQKAYNTVDQPGIQQSHPALGTW